MTHTDDIKNCGMREALVSYLYDEATSEEGRTVKTHLSECAACREELAAFERVRGMLQQWQLDDLPAVRIKTSVRRSALEAIRELLGVMPLWTKGLGVLATAMLVLAVLGTNVSIGSNGFSVSFDILRSKRGGGINVTDSANIEQVRAEMKTLVNAMIIESERRQRGELQAQLVSLESQLQGMHSADLARLASSIQEQRARLKSLERDVDRREGLDLTDILFSTTTGSGTNGGSQGSGN